MKMIVSWAIIIILLYTAQTSLLPYLDYKGVSANLMLLLTVSVAFIHGWKYGVAMGFVTGLLQDLTTGSFFGCVTFSHMTIGILFGKFSTNVFRDQFFFPVLSAPVAAVIHFTITLILIFLLGYRVDLIYALQNILLPLVIFQIIFAGIVHKIVHDFDKFAKRHG